MENFKVQEADNTEFNYEEFIATKEFKDLLKAKKRFITPYVVIFFSVYILMPILTGFTSVLEVKVIGWITGTWIYAFGIFVMVWVFSTIYINKSYEFDKDAEEIINKTILK